MGNFKRYDGYVMHIPQEFIDSKLPVCPFCKSDNPHWLLDSKMEMSLAGSRTYYQCERCQAIMSSTAADAGAEKGKSFAINPAMAALNAAQKGTKKQEVGVAYMRVDTLGTVCTDQSLMGKEFPITYFQEMAGNATPAAPAQEKAKFCTNCGTQLSAGAAFCSNCGAKQATTAAEPVAETVVIPEPIAETVEVEPVVIPAPVAESAAAAEPVVIPAPVAEPVAAAEPVVIPESAPAAPAAAVPYQFPLVALILIGVAAFYSFIMLFVNIHGFGSFLLNTLHFAPYVALVLGLILCKEKKNLLFAIGFLAMALFGFIGTISSFINNVMYAGRPGYTFFALMFSSAAWVLNAGIGVTYLLGKPKMATLKTLAAALSVGIAFLSMITVSIAFGGFGRQLLGFLFCTLPLYAAVVLFTPFKKAE